MHEFKRELDSIAATVETIENLGSDYFVTLNESRSRELVDIYEGLKAVFNLCLNLAESQKLEEAKSVVDFVYTKKGKGVAPAVLQKSLGWSVPLLESWEDNFKKRFEVVEKNLKQASSQFKAVGTVRHRNRNPTSLILADIRRKIFGISWKIPGWGDKD